MKQDVDFTDNSTYSNDFAILPSSELMNKPNQNMIIFASAVTDIYVLCLLNHAGK